MLKHRNDGVEEFHTQMLRKNPNPDRVNVIHSNEINQMDTW